MTKNANQLPAVNTRKLAFSGWVTDDALAVEATFSVADVLKANLVRQHNAATGEALTAGDVYWREQPDQTGANGEHGTLIEGVYTPQAAA